MATLSFEQFLKTNGVDPRDQEQLNQVKSVGVNTLPPEPIKKDGIIKSIAKDVAGTLLVKPAARAAEAVGRTGILGENVKKGYEEMADEGESQSFAGIEVPQQKAFGEGGAKQIAGEALKTASYLFPYGKAASAVGKTIVGGAKLTPALLKGAKIAGNVTSGATGGFAGGFGAGLAEDKTFGESAKQGLETAAFGAAIPAVAALPVGSAVRGAGRLVSKAGSELAEAVIPSSAKEAKILQTYQANKPFLQRISDVLSGSAKGPQTAGKTAVEKGLMGTKSSIGVQAKRATQTLWNDVISPRLKASEKAVDLDGFFSKIEDDIIAQNPELSRQKSLLEALDSVKEDYAGVHSISLEKLQKLKEGWAKFVPDKAYKGKPIAGAFNDVRNQLSGEARNTIYNELGDDVKKAYLDYGNLLGLQEYGQTAMTGAKLKGGAGSFISELASTALTPVATMGGQAIYRLGNGIEFIGKLGAKNLGEALGITKFPGDAAVDDIKKSLKGLGAIPKQLRLVGKGKFGNVYEGIKGKDAESFILKSKEGEIKNAFHHKDVGEDIDLFWGNNKSGYAKIVEKHPEVLGKLQDILDESKVVSSSSNRIKLESAKHKSVVRLDWNGESKKWILTSYEKKIPKTK